MEMATNKTPLSPRKQKVWLEMALTWGLRVRGGGWDSRLALGLWQVRVAEGGPDHGEATLTHREPHAAL